jgi:hypothetical protein
VITPSGVLWEHVRGERPGTAPESVKAAKATAVNGAEWLPRWSVNRSDGHRVRGLPRNLAACDVTVEKVDGRGKVFLLSVESERVVVRFKDRASGTAPHTGRITLTPVGILDLEKAFDAGLRAIELDNTVGAKAALDRVETLHGQAAPGALDAAYAGAMARALGQAKTAEWTRLGRTLRFADAAKPGSKDVVALQAWLKTASRPVFTDNFDRASLGAWKPERGSWSIENGRLRSKMGPHNAQIFLTGKTFKDYILTFQMESPDGPFRMGVLFRYTPTRFIQCVMAGCYGLVYIGGCSGMGRGPGGKVEDITVRYTFKTWSRSGGREYEFNRRKPYRVAIRCEGTAYACFVDGQQLAIGRDEKPVASAIGFHLHGGTATFDNVGVYRPVPLPTLEFQPPKP